VVTNIVDDPIDGLAFTGMELGLPLLVGGSSLVAGLAILWFGRRRRVATRE